MTEIQDLPEGWRFVSLGQMLDIQYGKGLPKRLRDESGSIAVYGSNGVIGQHTTAITKGATIIIGRKGSVGEVHFSPVQCWPIDTTFFIDQFPDGLDPRYLSLFLKSEDLQKLNIHAAIPGIRRDDLYRIGVPLPNPDEPERSLETQRRVVARIEAVFAELRAARELHQKVVEDTERLMDAVLGEVFPQSVNETDGLWSFVPVGAIGKVIGGGTPSKSMPKYWNGTIPWVSPKDMKSTVIEDTEDHITELGLQESSAKLIPSGAVLIVFRSGILAHSLPVAVSARKLTVNQDLKAIVPREGLDPRFVAYALTARTPAILSNCVKKGATVHSLDGSRFWEEVIPLPFVKDTEHSLQVQRSIVERLNAMRVEVDAMRGTQELDRLLLEKLEQAILTQAFQGEL